LKRNRRQGKSAIFARTEWKLSSLAEERTCAFGFVAPNRRHSFKSNCYGDLCFGVFALSVEIRPSAAATRETRGIRHESAMHLPMTDRRQRIIAALVEVAMTEANAKRFSAIAPDLAAPEQQDEMTALAKGKKTKAEMLKTANPPDTRSRLKSFLT